jgi:hypothetical protein
MYTAEEDRNAEVLAHMVYQEGAHSQVRRCPQGEANDVDTEVAQALDQVVQLDLARPHETVVGPVLEVDLEGVVTAVSDIVGEDANRVVLHVVHGNQCDPHG